jgi:hypothetical protein
LGYVIIISLGYVTGDIAMALTNAEKQARHRARQAAELDRLREENEALRRQIVALQGDDESDDRMTWLRYYEEIDELLQQPDQFLSRFFPIHDVLMNCTSLEEMKEYWLCDEHKELLIWTQKVEDWEKLPGNKMLGLLPPPPPASPEPTKPKRARRGGGG